jgi:hypothetical protein
MLCCENMRRDKILEQFAIKKSANDFSNQKKNNSKFALLNPWFNYMYSVCIRTLEFNQ